MRTWRALAVAALVVVAVFGLLGGVVSAHHSRAGYDTDGKEITLKGFVTEFRWRNPHVFIVFGVKDDKGNVVQWVGELSSITTMIAAGMSKNSFKPGDEITVIARPALAGTPHGLIVNIVRADGRTVLDENFRRQTR